MRQISVSLFFAFFYLKAICQTTDTDILKSFVISKDFCKYILPCNKCNKIVIVDTAGYFNIDSFFTIGKNIVIKRVGYPKGQIPINKEDAILRSCSSLLITKYVRLRRKIRIQYYHYPTNGIGWMGLKIKKNKIKQTGFSYGQL